MKTHTIQSRVTFTRQQKTSWGILRIYWTKPTQYWFLFKQTLNTIKPLRQYCREGISECLLKYNFEHFNQDSQENMFAEIHCIRGGDRGYVFKIFTYYPELGREIGSAIDYLWGNNQVEITLTVLKRGT